MYLSGQHCRLCICLSESEANPNNNLISTFNLSGRFPCNIYCRWTWTAELGPQSISLLRNLENCNPPNFCIFPKKSSTVTLLPIWWPDNQMHHFDLPLPPHRLSPLALHTCLRHVRLSWLHLFLPPSVLGRFLHLLMSRFFLLCPGHPRSKNRQLKVQTSKPILIALHGF